MALEGQNMSKSPRRAWLWIAVILAIAVVGWFFQRQRNAPQRAALSSRELATQVMAEYLAQHSQRKPVLVISNPFTQKAGRNPQIYAFEEAAIRGLKKGLGPSTPMKVVFPELRPEVIRDPNSVYVDPKTKTPLSFLVGEGSFDKLAKENPDHDIIVTLIGLPVSLDRVEIWSKPSVPQFALLLPDWRFVGNKEAVQRAVKSGKVIAAVVNKPGAPPESVPITGELKEEFAKRFLLVTNENIDQLVQTHPQLF
jgi:hypothetical protein